MDQDLTEITLTRLRMTGIRRDPETGVRERYAQDFHIVRASDDGKSLLLLGLTGGKPFWFDLEDLGSELVDVPLARAGRETTSPFSPATGLVPGYHRPAGA